NEPTKGRPVRLRRPCVAVPGKIQEIEGVVRGAPRTTHQIDVQHPSLPGGPGGLGDPSARDGIQQTGFPDVGAAEECDFGQRRIERNVGLGERADETRVAQASFFWRTRSVTSRGCRPSETHSAVMATSRTSSRLGRSNMMSVIISSRMARRPRAPVPRLIAFWAIALSASFSIVSRTSSSSNSFWYCLDRAFL